MTFSFVFISSNSLEDVVLGASRWDEDCESLDRVGAVRDEAGGCLGAFDVGLASSGSSPSGPGESVSFTSSDCPLSVSAAEDLEATWRKEGRLESAEGVEPTP